MNTNRLEAFSDGVLAIIITIMVLELRAPEGSDFASLIPLIPKFVSYLLSFMYVGIYWNNHHHLFHVIEKVDGKILWANLGLLLSLSLIPFTTAWMGEHFLTHSPLALYGTNLLISAVAFLILENVAIRHEGKDSRIGRALKSKAKENISWISYFVGVVASFYLPVVSFICYSFVAVMWLIPDRRMEKQLNKQ